MVQFTLERSSEVYVDVELSAQDKHDILDWILGEMNGLETDKYATLLKYPEQIKRIFLKMSH
jgi:hypothetical protein